MKLNSFLNNEPVKRPQQRRVYKLENETEILFNELVLNGKNIYDYHYEDLIENPNNVIPEIINWLDWDWDEKYLSPHQNKRNVYTASSAQIRKKFYSSSIGIWREYKELLEPAIEIIKTNKILREKIS